MIKHLTCLRESNDLKPWPYNVTKCVLLIKSFHSAQPIDAENLVWQENAMIVSNGPKDMSEKMLIDFLEEKGN
ncbi:Hypothetical predicted protein [Octopus vulgaris]|uniref:Uncharacterized protein n=1 Tax=Octopus vulgaris TaxID=6645 RepID=A0AA36AJX9_OCTVU|nr:Hypothetical predicted protein [Octopus vulgaris]